LQEEVIGIIKDKHTDVLTEEQKNDLDIPLDQLKILEEDINRS
jgi:hypothetical protein